ncbi:MAG: extracellular solute-binding protein [Dehalococcoidia bacterium]|nr:MAG: extracellular solute-binding protein [Dehalococcoidia bacterium]
MFGTSRAQITVVLGLVFTAFGMSACGGDTKPPPTAAASPTAPKPARPDMILATTTSTQDSGLLDVLVPAFQRATGYQVKVIAVGSGAAMQMGERGDADVLLVHSPAVEEKFVADGFGVERTLVMHNDFVVIGPVADPAGIKGSKGASEVMKKIADKRATFISRGDSSGTDILEKGLWKAASVAAPKGQSWYFETGQGMGATLTVAREKQGYTVTDRATFLAFTGKLDLPILLEGDPALLNVYHVMVPNPARLPKTNTDGGRAFKNFLVAADTQKLIGEFGKDKYGQALFFPDAGKPEPTER